MAMRKDIVSDEDAVRVHGNANFGPKASPRSIVDEGVAKCAVGYSCGSTQLAILREHGLVGKTGGYSPALTKKGKAYARAMDIYGAWALQQG